MSAVSYIPSAGYSKYRVSARQQLFFALIGLFLLLSPISISGLAASGGTLKWARVGILGAVFLVGMQWFRFPRTNELSFKLLLVAVVYSAAAVWSTSPIWGLLFKGMFVCAVVSAISLANCLRREYEFRAFLRTMTLTSLVATLGSAYLIFGDQAFTMWKGRLILAEMNANTMGLSAALFALLCAFHLAIGDSRNWQRIAWLCIVVMSTLVIYSGSRAAAITLLCGPLFLLPSLAKTTKQFLLGAAICGSVLAVSAQYWFYNAESESQTLLGRQQQSVQLRLISELTKQTRAKIWRSAYRSWMHEPWIGSGWQHTGNRWRFVQSSYLQIAVESGVLGCVVAVIFLLSSFRTMIRAALIARHASPFRATILRVFSACLFAMLFHGAFESAMVVGSSPNAILLGFSVAQLDLQLRSSM